MKILLIEPDKILGKVYKTALTRAGNEVRWFTVPQHAIHAADMDIPELVITELQLPGHSGIEFLYEFRSYSEWQKIPVILHTIVPWQFLQDQGHHFARLGVVKYLYKPTTTLEQLTHAIGDLSPVQS